MNVFFNADHPVHCRTVAPNTPGAYTVEPKVVISAPTDNITITGLFGSNPFIPTVAFSKDPACPLASLMLRTPVTISGSGSTQTATISSVDFSDVSPVPVDLYVCYATDNATFIPSPTEAKLTVNPAPCVESMNPATATAESTVTGGFSFTGLFGTSPAAPTIAFSTDPECPLAGLMLRRPASVSANGLVCSIIHAMRLMLAIHMVLSEPGVVQWQSG
jgi:hypothetical protein